MVYPIFEWKSRFLEGRGLQYPTGMPLYSYRMTNEEFRELEELLKERVSTYLRLQGIGDIARYVTSFPALFVLFAAEWWRRRYDGSRWSWEPIMDALGASYEGWNQAQRSECVEKGLQDWNLQLTNSHGLRFLGSIAFQGGLPMQLLASARGNIGRVLGRVLRLAATSNVEATDVQEWIRSLSIYLPKAYRQNEIFILLAEVILTVLRLKDAANLTTAVGAVEALDRYDPQWRNRFPLPVEDDQAKGLIEQLIKDAADARLVRATQKISAERRLELLDGDTYQLHSDIVLPEYIDGNELATLFDADASSLSRCLTIRFSRGDQTVEIGLRKLAGRDRYRLDRRSLDCVHDGAIAEHTMSLISPEGEIRHSTIARGEALCPDLPWVFDKCSSQTFQLVRQGSGSVGSHDAVLCIPRCWNVQVQEDGEAEVIGCLTGHDRVIWKFRGSVRLDDAAEHHFRVRSGQAGIVEEHLEWRGARIWDIFDRPAMGFRGIPKLYRISENGLANPVQGAISWRVPSGQTTLVPTGLVGPVDAVWPAEGETKWRARLALLPDQASFHIEPGDRPLYGQVRFVGWGIVGVEVEGEEMSSTTRIQGDDCHVQMEYLGAGSPPEWCDLNVAWRGNPNNARLRVPFPAKGVRSFDAKRRQISDGALIPADEICGVRMVGFLGNRAMIETCV